MTPSTRATWASVVPDSTRKRPSDARYTLRGTPPGTRLPVRTGGSSPGRHATTAGPSNATMGSNMLTSTCWPAPPRASRYQQAASAPNAPASATSVSPSAIDGNMGGPSDSPVRFVRPANASASEPLPGRSAHGPVVP